MRTNPWVPSAPPVETVTIIDFNPRVALRIDKQDIGTVSLSAALILAGAAADRGVRSISIRDDEGAWLFNLVDGVQRGEAFEKISKHFTDVMYAMSRVKEVWAAAFVDKFVAEMQRHAEAEAEAEAEAKAPGPGKTDGEDPAISGLPGAAPAPAPAST
jgi:hypothetical protein